MLSQQDRDKVRVELAQREQYFYHGTPDNVLDSIKKSGIDPEYENDTSAYSYRTEPKAMRYCTRSKSYLAQGTAETRACNRDNDRAKWVPSAKPVLLRTPATALLSRAFGLDHSFSEMARKAKSILSPSGQLAADDFIKLVSEYGIISCYEATPSSELEILQGDITTFCASQNNPGIWVPLLR